MPPFQTHPKGRGHPSAFPLRGLRPFNLVDADLLLRLFKALDLRLRLLFSGCF